ncbi:MAG: DEAD/DEAH box helicase family protein [Oligoflexia bacterium]|nr:DEAD/DEAH box helicase family protein [Oligoflexia bacterium]
MKSKYKEKIDRLIINSPFKEPLQHWDFEKTKGKHFIKEGRRPAGYVIATQSNKYKETGDFIELPLVNKIRPRVTKWRDAGYPGVTGITKRLLEFWNTKKTDGRDYEFFFCQKEAMETLIWLKEAHVSERVGIEVPKDGGDFERLCTKMATGTGKTYVMAMTIAWQILNKLEHPQDTKFSKYVFIVAPNLTVKSRLAVLDFNNSNNYYEEKKIVPYDLLPRLRQGKVHIENWHTLMWDSEETIQKRKSVDKRGSKSDEAYIRDVLGDMARAKNILIINDEAHHAWRHRREEKQTGVDRKEKERATCWIQGLDRIHNTRGILSCFDFSATPFAPSGTKGRASYKEDLFSWIVSDFGLMDAVESGLTKTPRFVVRDDGPVNPKNDKSKLYHIYNDESVKSNLTEKAKPEEILPELVRNAYLLLAYDWEKTLKSWEKAKMPTPPVMISAVNRQTTADRVKHMFDKKKITIPELCKEEKTALIYSDLDFSKEKDKELREKVNTVGQTGKPGEQLRHIISVAMLSEGWNCQTVTHIMGLRAFSSQLLCEQIVGRGLRRTSYDLNKEGFFDSEYVNIFGIPFSFIPQEESQDGNPRPASPKLPIFSDPEKEKYKIIWPNVERIDFNLKPCLTVDFEKIEPLRISEIRKIADLAPEINGQPDYKKIKTIDMEKLITEKDVRIQRLIFTASAIVYDQISPDWKKKVNKEFAFSQLIHIVEEFLTSDKFQIEPKSFQEDEIKRKIAIMMGMEQIVRKVCFAITHQNSKELVPIYKNPKYRSTKEILQWRTGKKTDIFKKTHLNRCVVDSTWELAHARELDRNPHVEAWAKNDHLGFEIKYIHNGALYDYVPDFIVRLSDKSHLILEVKGVKKPKDESKWEYMKLWIKAVNQDKENGIWRFDISQDETGQKVHEIIDKCLKVKKSA